MALRESFTELMKAAMKAGDKRRTGTSKTRPKSSKSTRSSTVCRYCASGIS